MASSKEVLETLLDPERRRQDEVKERSARFTNIMLLVILAIVIGMWVWAFVKTAVQPKIETVSISNARVVGDHVLCPGDTLVLAYEFRASGAGKLVEDATVWRETPPKTIIYSDEHSFLVEGTIDQENFLAWRVPFDHLNASTARVEPLPPGEYRRIFSVSSVSRPAVFAMASVAFEIVDCAEAGSAASHVAGKLQSGGGEWKR